nr:hypothetical protein [Candidatus Njordarchaeota archaeon]
MKNGKRRIIHALCARKLKKQYVGKQAADLKLRQEALTKIRQTKKQYKYLLKKEQKLFMLGQIQGIVTRGI